MCWFGSRVYFVRIYSFIGHSTDVSVCVCLCFYGYVAVELRTVFVDVHRFGDIGNGHIAFTHCLDGNVFEQHFTLFVQKSVCESVCVCVCVRCVVLSMIWSLCTVELCIREKH